MFRDEPKTSDAGGASEPPVPSYGAVVQPPLTVPGWDAGAACDGIRQFQSAHGSDESDRDLAKSAICTPSFDSLKKALAASQGGIIDVFPLFATIPSDETSYQQALGNFCTIPDAGNTLEIALAAASTRRIASQCLGALPK